MADFGDKPTVRRWFKPGEFLWKGDPDDEQSLVRFLVYANDFDIEGIIANRPIARGGENKNPIRDGLGIVRAMIKAYGECYPNLVKHDSRAPRPEQLLARTVAGSNNVDDGVDLVLQAVDAEDSITGQIKPTALIRASSPPASPGAAGDNERQERTAPLRKAPAISSCHKLLP